MELKFVDITNAELAQLSAALDRFYLERFGEAYRQYQPHNALDDMACAIVAFEGGEAVGCACWRALDAVTAEVKRVFVQPRCRRCGIASALLDAIERHAAATGCHRTVVETAKDTPEAVAFYRAIGYHVLTEGYGVYAGDADCVCLEKTVSDGTMR